MPHFPQSPPTHNSSPAWRGLDCSICMESLATVPVESPSTFSILTSHKPIGTTPTKTNTTGAPAHFATPDQTRETSVRTTPSGQYHFFHTLCYAQQVASNGTRIGPDNLDWQLRCPLCQQHVNLSEVTPVSQSGQTPNNKQRQLFTGTLSQLVESQHHKVKPQERRRQNTLPVPAIRSWPAGPRPITYYPHAGPFFRMASPLPQTTPAPASLASEAQRAVGSMFTGMAVTIAMVHGPIGLVVVTAGLGIAMLGAGLLKHCSESASHIENDITPAEVNPHTTTQQHPLPQTTRDDQGNMVQETTAPTPSNILPTHELPNERSSLLSAR